MYAPSNYITVAKERYLTPQRHGTRARHTTNHLLNIFLYSSQDNIYVVGQRPPILRGTHLSQHMDHANKTTFSKHILKASTKAQSLIYLANDKFPNPAMDRHQPNSLQ